MLYFICWAAFLGILILATIIAAVMDKSGGKKTSAVAPAETGMDEAEFDAADIDEAVPEEPMDMQEMPADSVEAFGEPVADDFAEFENEFK